MGWRRRSRSRSRCRRLIPSVALLVIGLADAAPATWTGPGFWSAYRNGPARNGFNRAESTLASTNVAALKQAFAKKGGSEVDSSPAIADGKAFFSRLNGMLYALDLPSGATRWARDLSSDARATYNRSSPAVANGVVYAGAGGEHTMWALSADTGAEVWKRPLTGDMVASPTVSGGVVYFATRDFTVWALDATTGAVRWTARTANTHDLWSSPAVANGLVYVASDMLYAFDAVTGEWRWGKALPGGSSLATPAVANGMVYLAADPSKPKLFAFDAVTGDARWSAPLAGESWLASPAVADGVVYASTSERLCAFGALTGAGKWCTGGIGNPHTSPAVANGVVYHSASFAKGGELHALDASSGRILWSSTGLFISSSSPAVSNGTLYVGSSKVFEGDPVFVAFKRS